MPTVQTQIADLVPNAGVLSNIVVKQYRANNSLLSSGVAVTGPEADLLMTGGRQIQSLNFINKVDTTEYNHSSDDFDAKGGTGKIDATEYMALRQDLNWGWAYTDLVRLVTKYDVRGGLVSAIPLYWSEVAENIAVAGIKGVLAVAPELISGEVTDTFDPDALIDAAATTRDPRAKKTMFVSRKTFAKLQKRQRTAGIAPSVADFGVYQFDGYSVIITDVFGDEMTVIATEGALVNAAGVLPSQIGMEIKRDADAGAGGGGEILRTRMSIVNQVQGASYKGTAKPSLATLATAASWELVGSLEDIGIRAVLHAA